MPTKAMMRHVEVQRFPPFEEEVTCVAECHSLYEGLYHRNGNFDADYGDMTVEESRSVTPMPIKRRNGFVFVTVVTLTVTMDVNLQGCCPCSGIRTWNFLMLYCLRS